MEKSLPTVSLTLLITMLWLFLVQLAPMMTLDSSGYDDDDDDDDDDEEDNDEEDNDNDNHDLT